MSYHNILLIMEMTIELLGVGIIFGGVIMGIYRAIRAYGHDTGKHIYTHIREEIGRAILLGLEILIAVDIIKTVTTELTFENTINLALIVLIRTILSISLEVEIEQRWPWQKEQSTKKVSE